jgi:hypothetical protein
MSRSIETDRNSFLEVLLKLIPSEIIAVHVFVQGVMPRTFWPSFVVFLLLAGITPLYLYWAMGVRSRPQLVVSTLSLVVWIYALGQGPFRFMRAPWWEPWYGSVLLALWTLVPPMFLTRAEPQAVAPPARKSRTRKR